MTQSDYLDSLSMWAATAAAPEQLLMAATAATEVLKGWPLPLRHEIRSVVIFGMGTGALAGEVVAAYCAERAPIPVLVGNGYSSPSFVGPHTLVFALSYSGDTEETTAAMTSAIAQGAQVVVVAGGGVLAQMAVEADLVRFDIPAGLPAARVALGALVAPMLMTLAHVGLAPAAGPALDAALSSVLRRRDALVLPDSPAEEVARLIGRTMPLIYGSVGSTAAAARRWKTQINENAKTPAFYGVLPELSHNEVAGWGQDGDVTRQVLSLVTLRHVGEHPGVSRRFDLIVEATDEVMANVIPVWTEGADDLSRFFDLALFGDFVSLHMAGRESIDPGPTPALSDVEATLRRERAGLSSRWEWH